MMQSPSFPEVRRFLGDHREAADEADTSFSEADSKVILTAIRVLV